MEHLCRLLAALFAVALAFSPVTAGCPHNQGWLLGDGDLDDAASLVGAGFVDAFLLCGTSPPPISIEFLWPNGDKPIRSHAPSASPTRGPPAV